MKRHLPCGITQYYLPPDTGECALRQPQPDRPVLNLNTREGWEAEFTLVLVLYGDGLPVCKQSPTHVVTT